MDFRHEPIHLSRIKIIERGINQPIHFRIAVMGPIHAGWCDLVGMEKADQRVKRIAGDIGDIIGGDIIVARQFTRRALAPTGIEHLQFHGDEFNLNPHFAPALLDEFIDRHGKHLPTTARGDNKFRPQGIARREASSREQAPRLGRVMPDLEAGIAKPRR